MGPACPYKGSSSLACAKGYTNDTLVRPGFPGSANKLSRTRELFMRKYVLLAAGCLATAFAQSPAPKHKVLFNRFRWPEVQIMIADADGKNERILGTHSELEYSPSYSADGKWVVFTRERSGLSDI